MPPTAPKRIRGERMLHGSADTTSVLERSRVPALNQGPTGSNSSRRSILSDDSTPAGTQQEVITTDAGGTRGPIDHDPLVAREFEDDNSLTPQQQDAGNAIVRELQSRNSADRKLVIILEGVSGIGKSTLLREFQEKIVLNGGEVEEPNVFDPKLGTWGLMKVRQSRTHYVIPALPSEAADITETIKIKRFKLNYDVVSLIIPGMDEKEILAYIGNLPGINQASLSPDQIAKYSMGVPLLAEQLCLPGLTEDFAVKIAARYITENFSYSGLLRIENLAEDAKRYLKLPVPDIVVSVLPEIAGNIYQNLTYEDYLHIILLNQKEFAPDEISPLFIAQQSPAIYKDAVSGDTYLRPAEIDIYVPELTPEQFSQVQQSFGFNGERFVPSESRRLRMFGAERKVSFWAKDTAGKIYEDHHENNSVKRNREELMSQMDALFRIKARTGASFAIHSEDHAGIVSTPMHVGWAAESLLQQLGIAYGADNITYVYHPEKKEVEILK